MASRVNNVCPVCHGMLVKKGAPSPACYGECLEFYRVMPNARIMLHALNVTARGK